jgi:hypothetical protein
MRNLIRSPLTWIVSAEIVVVGVLVVLAWSVVAGAARPVLLSPTITLPDATAGDTFPGFPDLSGTPSRGPQPGLNLNSAFWRDRLVELNRDQVLLQRLEWRIVHGAMDAAKRYVETVVLPAVRRAAPPARV